MPFYTQMLCKQVLEGIDSNQGPNVLTKHRAMAERAVDGKQGLRLQLCSGGPCSVGEEVDFEFS